MQTKKTPPNTAMERNSGNPAPTIDIEPEFYKAEFPSGIPDGKYNLQS